MPQGAAQNDLRKALLSLDRLGAERVLLGYSRDASLMDLIDGLVVPVLDGIGRDWESGVVALSEVYMAGRLAERVVDSILADEPEGLVRPQPRLAIVVLEDEHVLGKRIVESQLRTAGYRVDDLGSGTSVESTVAAVCERETEVLLVSVLMLRSALLVADLKRRLADQAVATRVVVGGAPFRLDPELWREVGADACGASASDALDIVPRLWGRPA